MTCYLRHMDWLFEALDLPYDAASRAQVDGALRAHLRMPKDATCPQVWARVKKLSEVELVALVPEVRRRLG